MSYGTVVMKITVLFLFSFVFLGTNGGDKHYELKFTDSVVSCDDFENDFMDCTDLKLGSLKGDEGDDAAKLSGKIKTFLEINSDHDIEIEIWKMMEIGDEYMYNARVNFCASLEKDDAPWSPVMEKLNISCCPVPVSTFEVQGLTISLDSMRDVMCHEFCGEYSVHVSLIKSTDKVSCHVIEIRIVEVDDEEDS